MFMFWSKRTLLTKRLLKAKVRGEHETECETQENNHHIIPYSIGSTSESSSKHPTSGNGGGSNGSNSAIGPSTTLGVASAGKTTTTTTNCCCCCYCCCFTTGSEDNRRHNHHQHQDQQRYSNAASASVDDTSNEYNGRINRCKDLLKSLKENQLEILLAAVESYGADLSGCVLVPRRRRADGERRTVENPTNDYRTTMCCREEKNAVQQTQRYSARYHYHHNQHSQHSQRLLQQRQTRGERRSDDNDENAMPMEERNLPSPLVADPTSTTTNSTCSRFGRGDRQTSYRSRNSAGATPASTGRNNAVEPHLLCCQIWRWPDLADSDELKRLPVCQSDQDPVYVCCNPYHWSRLCKPESPPPPYCLIADRLRPEDRAPSEGGGEGDAGSVINRHRNANPQPLLESLTTNGEDASGQREWCTLAYWELGGRVGRLYPVEPSTVNVFDSLLDGDGLCLATLAENHSTSPAIQRTRSKIGLGLTLSYESDGVWAYNRSENPIFVNSPTLDDPESRTLLVYRVPPGFCLNIFDRAKNVHRHYHHQQQSSTSLSSCSSSNSPNNAAAAAMQGLTSGPVDVNSVRISFAKGWGPKYSRQEVTSCPCWLEVLLAPCR